MVKRGVRWKIGNGKDINIWHEPWLRGAEDPYIQSPIVQGHENMVVSYLIDVHTKRWKNHVLTQLFQPNEVQQITEISLLRFNEPDKRMWRFSTSGEYSVHQHITH